MRLKPKEWINNFLGLEVEVITEQETPDMAGNQDFYASPKIAEDTDNVIPLVNVKSVSTDIVEDEVEESVAEPTIKDQIVTIFAPNDYPDAQEIADNLLAGKIVIINFINSDEVHARRICDFLTGSVYVLGGDIQRLAADMFICTPSNIEIDNELTDQLIDQQ